MGSHLVVINSREEQEFLFNLAKEKVTNVYETKYYIGLTSYRNGQWQWVDQTPYEKTATYVSEGDFCLQLPCSGNLENPIYSLQKDVLQFMSRETETPTHTVTGITFFASQVAIVFVNRQSNLSEEGNSTLDEGSKETTDEDHQMLFGGNKGEKWHLKEL
ncbi:hypothetical protein BTVI_133518 [Pitangus sulphuratus]|nr:hypothetical protein BTVI_133518 [Pitangus sulphuratus]